MASLLWTVLLISVAAPCLKAADLALGDACTDGGVDKCVGAGLICEDDKCVIDALKVGRNCTGSTPPATDASKCGDLATTHLECTGNSGTECKCAAGFTGNQGEVCKPDGSGVQTPAAGALGGACKSDGSCTDATSVCDTDTKCKLKAGGTCTTAGDSTNCPTGSTCPTDKCECTSPLAANSDGLCKPASVGQPQTPVAGALGGDCKPDGTCTDDTSVCDTDKCKLKAGGGCTAANGANCVTGTTCKTDKCVCTLPKVANQTSGLCIDVPAGKVGYACTTGNKDDCPSAKHLKCDDGKKECICDNGFSGSRGGDCSSGSAALTSVTSLALVALFWASRHFLKE